MRYPAEHIHMCWKYPWYNIICCASVLPHVVRTKRNVIKLWCRSPFYYTFLPFTLVCLRNYYSLCLFAPLLASFATSLSSVPWWKWQILLLIFACFRTSFDDVHIRHTMEYQLQWIYAFSQIWQGTRLNIGNEATRSKTIMAEEGVHGKLY